MEFMNVFKKHFDFLYPFIKFIAPSAVSGLTIAACTSRSSSTIITFKNGFSNLQDSAQCYPPHSPNIIREQTRLHSNFR